MNNKYIIIPGCSDLNRGDQALVWETKQLAEDCGFIGDFYLTTEQNEPVDQSKQIGLNIITPIMEHPSRAFSNKENISYDIKLKIKWGVVSIFDFIGSLFYFTKPTRNFAKLFLKKEKRYSLEIMEQSNAFFVKGGGLIQSYGGLTSTYSMYFWVYHILLAKALKKPIYVMPNSYGPFKGPLVETIVKKALKSCTVVTSRETYSQSMVKEHLGIQVENYPDLAFYLSKADLDKETIFKEYDLPCDRKLVALTMRPHRFPNSKTPEKDYMRFKMEMADFIKWLYESGFMPVIIEHTLAVNSHENDGACIRDIVSMLNEKEYRVISNKEYNCYDLKCIYSFCDYIVGTRFHSVIFSLSSGIPGIAITYAGNKGQGIMHDIGLDDYAIAIGDVRAHILKEKFSKLLKEEPSIKRKISEYLSKASEQRKLFIKKILDSNAK